MEILKNFALSIQEIKTLIRYLESVIVFSI